MPFCARQTSHGTHEVSLEPSSIHKEALEHFLHMDKPLPTPPPTMRTLHASLQTATTILVVSLA
jgi:uncharacterized Fe-S cluster-containing MiaB family protein